ncbi:hypothetical protein RUM44_002240 [Polyplax serrata]|uniref:E3 ubiquitin-protein ligase TM129 n=1 Tax=Polyplax serrata TaxID=468196 RepID=A0ABR1AMN7_POLSC
MESVALFTFCYILFTVCFIFPPPEVHSVGLTIESIFSFWIKDEGNCFVRHHVRRTVATLLTHSCIPLGYLLGLRYVLSDASSWEGSTCLDFLTAAALILPTIASVIVFKWYFENWRSHPIAKNLRNFTTGESDINRIASDIDSEYRSIDKIIIKCNALTRVIATDNWIIQIQPYTVNFSHQSDSTLVVSSSDSYLYVPDRPEGSQYLTIDVKSTRENVKPFQIRINSSDFKDLQDKMIRPINIVDNIIVHGNLADCFLKEFKEHIKQNPTVVAPDNLDVCIGCLLNSPNVKLMTSCGDTTGVNRCTMCYCKPLWCQDCMGKWFASRQDQEKPENWLSSKCTCPMCRSTFCLLDVCLLVPRPESSSQQ